MSEKRYKKRGSTLLLMILLVVLVAVTAFLVMSMQDSQEAAVVETENVPTEASEEKSIDDEVAATTLIHAGDEAPDFSVEMLDGGNVTLSTLQGKPTLLIFWATWCPPCREELAHLQEGVIDVYGDKINVLPVSRGEKREVVEEFITKMGYTFAVGLDGEQTAYRKYATNYIPRCFVIDSKGTVVYSGVGYDEGVAGEVKTALDKALL